MMARRSQHDELRREGEQRTRRTQQVTKELSGWRHRLETAEKRSAELADRKTMSEAELTSSAELASQASSALLCGSHSVSSGSQKLIQTAPKFSPS